MGREKLSAFAYGVLSLYAPLDTVFVRRFLVSIVLLKCRERVVLERMTTCGVKLQNIQALAILLQTETNFNPAQLLQSLNLAMEATHQFNKCFSFYEKELKQIDALTRNLIRTETLRTVFPPE